MNKKLLEMQLARLRAGRAQHEAAVVRTVPDARISDGVRAIVTGPAKIRLEVRVHGHLVAVHEAWRGWVGKTRVWVMNGGKTTLAAVARECWPDASKRPDPTRLQEQLDLTLAAQSAGGRK